MTDIDHGPTPDDVVAHAVMEMTPVEKLDRFESTILTLPPKLWDGSLVVYDGYDAVLLHGATGNERCFVGQAIVRAPDVLGVDPDQVVEDLEDTEEERWTAHAYGVPVPLVRRIFIGVVNLRFDDAVRFAKDCIAVARAHAGDPDFYAYPEPDRYETRDEDEQD